MAAANFYGGHGCEDSVKCVVARTLRSRAKNGPKARIDNLLEPLNGLCPSMPAKLKRHLEVHCSKQASHFFATTLLLTRFRTYSKGQS